MSGVTNTAGSIVGSAGRGVGDTFNDVTGKNGKPIGDGIKNITGGIEGGAASVANGVRRAGGGEERTTGDVKGERLTERVGETGQLKDDRSSV